jgi:hypothetical protein
MDLVLLRGREEMEMERRGNTRVGGICTWRFGRREGIFLIFMGELLLMVLINMVGTEAVFERLRIIHGYIVQVHFRTTQDGWQRSNVL